MYEIEITKEHAKKILDAIDDNRFLIRVKFIRVILKLLTNISSFVNQRRLVKNSF